ncbi:PE-PGRS family protein [Variovorax sp. WDL1]|nr:PE-PGRS family protein [Variovorax sp. WDL1]
MAPAAAWMTLGPPTAKPRRHEPQAPVRPLPPVRRLLGRRLRPEHGGRDLLLHDLLDHSAAGDRDRDRGCAVRTRGRGGPHRRADFRPGGPRGRDRGRGDAAQRERARQGPDRRTDQRSGAAGRCHDRVRRAAERARPHLACPRAREALRPMGSAARATAVLRADPGAGLPADGVAGGERRAVGLRQLVRRAAARLGGAVARTQHRDLAGHRHPAVRDDLQADADGAHRVAGRLGRRPGDGGAFRARQAGHRPVPWQERRQRVLCRGGLAGAAGGLGVLRGADLPAGGRVHQGLRQCEGLDVGHEGGRGHEGRSG